MDANLKKDILQIIEEEIAIGFKKPLDILEVVIDTYNEVTIDEVWVENKIEKLYQQKLQQSEEWQHPTDFEKLEAVFDCLLENGIIALHNAGYTRNDCVAECEAVMQELDLFKTGSIGYCYYSTQDIKRIIHLQNPLFIGFQSVTNTEKESLAVAKIIIEELKKYNFDVVWDENSTSRIKISNFDWKKIPQKNDYNYKNVLNHLKHHKKEQKAQKKPGWKFWKL